MRHHAKAVLFTSFVIAALANVALLWPRQKSDIFYNNAVRFIQLNNLQ